MASFGQRLRRARVSAGLTQEEVAERLGGKVSCVSVSNWETDKAVPSTVNQSKLVQLYNDPTMFEDEKAEVDNEEDSIKVEIRIPKKTCSIQFSINVQSENQDQQGQPTFIFQPQQDRQQV